MERGVQGTAWVFLESRVPLGSPRRRLREYEGRSRMSDAVCSVLVLRRRAGVAGLGGLAASASRQRTVFNNMIFDIQEVG